MAILTGFPPSCNITGWHFTIPSTKSVEVTPISELKNFWLEEVTFNTIVRRAIAYAWGYPFVKNKPVDAALNAAISNKIISNENLFKSIFEMEPISCKTLLCNILDMNLLDICIDLDADLLYPNVPLFHAIKTELLSAIIDYLRQKDSK